MVSPRNLEYLDEHYKDTLRGWLLCQVAKCLEDSDITLSADFEEELVAHAIDLRQRFFGMTLIDLRRGNCLV